MCRLPQTTGAVFNALETTPGHSAIYHQRVRWDVGAAGGTDRHEAEGETPMSAPEHQASTVLEAGRRLASSFARASTGTKIAAVEPGGAESR